MIQPVPVRHAYDAWAADYDTDANATRDLDAAVLRAADLPLEGTTVVEFGAGTGKNTAYLASRAARVMALDLSPAMLERARARVTADHVAFVEHDVTLPWPVAAGTADLVVGNLVLEHVADLAPVFAEAQRALRPGGLLYLCELHPYRQLRGSVARFAATDGDARVEAYVHSVAEYLTAALAGGFELTSIAEPVDETSTGGGTPPVPRLLQLTLRAR